MARFYLVRHGEPDYIQAARAGFWGFGRDLAPLSPRGIDQARRAASDPRLRTAEMIVSSPYTRALQTAQIIAGETGLEVRVEMDLHEWLPDTANRLSSGEESARAAQAFAACKGVPPPGETPTWETLAHMRQRVRAVADRYAGMDTVILVGHGMAFRTLCAIPEMGPGEIVECLYRMGQPDCPYLFL